MFKFFKLAFVFSSLYITGCAFGLIWLTIFLASGHLVFIFPWSLRFDSWSTLSPVNSRQLRVLRDSWSRSSIERNPFPGTWPAFTLLASGAQRTPTTQSVIFWPLEYQRPAICTLLMLTTLYMWGPWFSQDLTHLILTTVPSDAGLQDLTHPWRQRNSLFLWPTTTPTGLK